MKQLLELRRRIKKRKPHFIRQESHKRMKLDQSWRRPKGIHSKIRLRLKGYHKHVTIGYGSPSEVKGCHSSGLKMVVVHSINDISKMNREECCAIIGATVGLRKRIELLKQLKEKNITVVNVQDIESYIKQIEENKKIKAEQKKNKKEKKAKKEKPKDKLAEKVMTEEEKKEQEKKEKDKALTKKA